MYVCMHVCLTVALSDCVHRKGQHQLGQGRRLSKESYFPNHMRKPGSQHIIGFHEANFALVQKGWAEKPLRGNPGQFQALSQLTKRATHNFTSRKITKTLFLKDLLQSMGLLLCLVKT